MMTWAHRPHGVRTRGKKAQRLLTLLKLSFQSGWSQWRLVDLLRISTFPAFHIATDLSDLRILHLNQDVFPLSVLIL